MTPDTPTGFTGATQKAVAMVDHWSADDKRFFVNFMCGYDPDAVTAFEESLRRIAARTTDRRRTAA
jgi:hypothetical protein